MRPVSSKQKVWNAALAAGSVSSAAALIAPLLARALGRENEKVTASQVEILGRRAGLEEKQAAMLERQHEVFERELKRRAVLKLLLPRPPTASGDGPTRYELFLTNDGDKVGTGF